MASVSTEEFAEDDLGRMLWAKRPDGSGLLKLRASPELVQDYRNWLAEGCEEHEFEVVAVQARNGSLMYRRQCVRCGNPSGQWISKEKVTDAETVKKVPADLREEYAKQRDARWKAVQGRHVVAQLREGDSDYADYLSSPEWKAKRLKVLRRADNICEGCGERKATEVHHLSYRHVGNEFLWELVAICDDCHQRVHAKEQSLDSENAEEFSDDSEDVGEGW
jgi:5-methylcytosine-specific restriction endonuclease McrA